MLKKLNYLRKKSGGFGTVEVVLITAVLIALALMFRTAITSYAQKLMDSVFNEEETIQIVGIENDN